MNPITKPRVETKSCQNTKKKIPINGVKNFMDVKFESNITIMWFRLESSILIASDAIQMHSNMFLYLTNPLIIFGTIKAS